MQSILIVEDDDIDVMMVTRCFAELNISSELIIAENGEEALDILLKSDNKPRPNLVLLDINMPKMNGLEFLEKFKKIEHFKHTPVVILTASKEEKDILRSYELGIAGYLTKSIEYAEFMQNISIIYNYWSINEVPE